MPLEEVWKQFPHAEEVSSCHPRLVGGDPPAPIVPPDAAQRTHAQCARSIELAGINKKEWAMFETVAKQIDDETVLPALIYMAAQIRGSLRAGVVSEKQILMAQRARDLAVQDVLALLVGEYMDGGRVFVRPKNARRPLGAMIREDCVDYDADRIRTYVTEGYSLDRLDAEARTRLAYGKCRVSYVQHETQMKRLFLGRAGIWAGIGLARATRPDRKLSPDNPSSYQVYTIRNGLDAGAARLGVLLVNELSRTEAFWSGAIALKGRTDGPFGGAVIWGKNGKVDRVLVNLSEWDQLDALPKDFDRLLGVAGKTEGNRVRWQLSGDRTVTLDLGIAQGLWLERTGERVPDTAASTPPALSPAAPASAGL